MHAYIKYTYTYIIQGILYQWNIINIAFELYNIIHIRSYWKISQIEKINLHHVKQKLYYYFIFVYIHNILNYYINYIIILPI